MEVFTVVQYDEKIENKTVKRTVFENKNFSTTKIFDIAKKNNFKVIVITRDIILVEGISPFYRDGKKVYRHWTFFTTEEWKEILKEEAEYK